MTSDFIRRLALIALALAAGSAVAAPRSPAPPAPPAAGNRAAKVLEDIPGLNFSSLSPAAQAELAAVFTDEFCYCGCPHELGACLRNHPTCKHARRMAILAASQAAAGLPSVEITTTLSNYYLSFRGARRSFSTDDRMCAGKKDAKVTLVEFSDFECPACRSVRGVLDAFAKENSANVRFCYLPYPLPTHPHAAQAAQAALFARDHGKFWAMHDLLFENQPSLTVDLIKQLVSKLGLNATDFVKAMDSGRYTAELSAAKDAGRAAGLEQTPTILLNGRKFNLPFNRENLQHSLEDELEWVANRNGWAPD